MTKKLILTIEDSVIDSAKKYAHNNGKILSDIVENYLKWITVQDDKTEVRSPKVTELMGSVKVPKDFEYKKEYSLSVKNRFK